MKVSLKFFMLVTLLWGLTVSVAQAGLNAGFVNGLWYSQSSFFAEDEVRVYTVIQNQSGFDITGTVSFFDNGNSLGQSDFSIVNGRLIEKWADWLVSQGEHEISVKISNTKKIEIGKSPESIELDSDLSISEKHNIDLDTDGDGVGNKNDFDDDGDGNSDEEEKILGTNPLVFDKKVEPIKNEISGGENQKTKFVEIGDPILAGKITEQTIDLANNISEKVIKTVEETKKFLEKEKDKVINELEQKKKEEALKDTPKIDENKNPYIASIVGSIPELKEVYKFVLSVMIYILNSWWILLSSIFILVYFIWKIIRRRIRRRF